MSSSLSPASPLQVLARRRWRRYEKPFPYFHAEDVFDIEFYRRLEDALAEVLRRGLSDHPREDRFSRNMPNSDAYAWNFPRDLDGPLALFYTHEWHELVCRVTETTACGDVNGALHHHQLGSASGSVHRDLGVGWFSTQPRPDRINPMDLSRCSYVDGRTAEPSIESREMVRAITMIFYLCNSGWSPGDGGETGLYASKEQPVDHPSARIPPRNNSLLVFENTPFSYHSFLRNRRLPRNSVILWLHRPKVEVVTLWGESAIYKWRGRGGQE